MSRKAMLQECDQETSELLCHQPRPIQKALSCLLLGVVLKGSINLARTSTAIPGTVQTGSKERRSQRLLANQRLAEY